MAEEIRFSATQIQEFRLCKRKWAWGRIDKIPRVSSPAAELGTRVHEVLENWLKHGTVIDTSTEEGQIAAAGVHHLPPFGSEYEVEEWIELYTDAAMYVGKVDLSYVNPETGRRVVHDHKTTSDLKWAKDEEELRKDPQSIIYAAEAMARYGGSEIELKWVYHTTRGKRKSQKVHLVIVRDEVEAGLKEIDETAAEMLEVYAKGQKAMDLPPNVKSCEAFGGCQYQNNCNITTRERLKALMAETLLEKMKRERAEKAGGTNGTAAAAAPTPASPPKVEPPKEAAPRTVAPPKGINPPAAAPAAAAATLDLSPLVAALKEVAAKHAPIDLRDQIAIAICSSGDPTAIEGAYELADLCLSKRGGK